MFTKFKSIIFTCLLVLGLVSCSSDTIEENPLIPTPVQYSTTAGSLELKGTVRISISDTSLEPAVEYLAELFKGALELQRTTELDADIVFSLKDAEARKGAYKLDITSSQLVISATDYSGVVSALASLRQLLPITFDSLDKPDVVKLPLVSIHDYPRLDWRGLMLDSSRHFWTKEEVKGVLDLMARYKLNKFHWHLTDDQGWRIEIKQYPLLTEKGAWRKLNSHDRSCLRRAEKGNPDFNLPSDRLKVIDGDTIYGGYYTQEDIREIIQYAAVRGIEVIPEIDMPGHFLAAIGQYPEVACDGLIGWGSTFSSPLCPGKDSTLEFCKAIYREVFELFPSKYVHMGGDEVDKTNWKRCSDCQLRMKKEKLSTEEDLQAWFVREMEQFFLAHDKRFIGWDEVLNDGLSAESTIMWWRGWNPKALPQATAEGKTAINTHNIYLYFDYEQDKETLAKLYGYNPVPEDLSEAQKNLVLGVQANVWTEWIPSIQRLEYMVMPRMLALSEIAWCEPENKPDLADFYQNIQAELQRMDALGVNYRVPSIEGFYAVNAFVDEALVDLHCPLPTAEIRYTTDGTLPTLASARYTEPFTIRETTSFLFRAFRANGTADEPVAAYYKKTAYQEAVQPTHTLSSGLQVAWYDYKGSRCREIDSAQLNATYTIPTVSIPAEAQGNIGLVFRGYIEVPQDDIYTFSLLSDDGSTLRIGQELVIDNDGAHSPQEVVGQVALQAGLHPIEVRYFDQNGGLLRFYQIDKQGNKEEVGEEWFKH